jgi:hypothetical protein
MANCVNNAPREPSREVNMRGAWTKDSPAKLGGSAEISFRCGYAEFLALACSRYPLAAIVIWGLSRRAGA